MYGSYGYGYSSSTGNFLAGMGVGSIILSIAASVFGIICMWRIFVKAGEPGWKCLIPVYNIFVFMKIAWEARYFVWLFVCMIAAILLTSLGASSRSEGLTGLSLVLLIAIAIVAVIFSIIMSVKLARRFGKSGGFAVGLIFLSPIFMAILAFDSSDYDRNRA